MTRLEPQRLAVVVHEVRSPVAALAALREAIRGPAAPGPAWDVGAGEAVELVRLALAACDAIERIVAGTPVTAIEPRRVDVGRLARDAAAAGSLQGRPVAVAVAPGLPTAEIDPVSVRQALDNLIANALASTGPAGSVTVDARVEEGALVLSVRDDGPGIPEHEQARVFEPGVRLGSSYDGSGLGLAIVKAIAEAHGGTVRLRSTPGAGTTVSLVLPLGASTRTG